MIDENIFHLSLVAVSICDGEVGQHMEQFTRINLVDRHEVHLDNMIKMHLFALSFCAQLDSFFPNCKLLAASSV